MKHGPQIGKLWIGWSCEIPADGFTINLYPADINPITFREIGIHIIASFVVLKANQASNTLLSRRISTMTMDKSLRVNKGLIRSRSVLTRAERIERLKASDRWGEGDSPFGLDKVRVFKLALKKKKKKKEEEEEGDEGDQD